MNTEEEFYDYSWIGYGVEKPEVKHTDYDSLLHISNFWIGGVASIEQQKKFVTDFMRDYGGMYWLSEEDYDDFQMLSEEAYYFVRETFGTFAGLDMVMNVDRDLNDGSEESELLLEVENHTEEFLEAAEEFMTKKIDDFWKTVRGF
jgi:hypothetical protein